MYYSTTYPSPIGIITIACNESNNLVGLWIEGQKYHGDTITKDVLKDSTRPIFAVAEKWLDKYFSGAKPDISELPLAPIGSEFRQAVWSILREIPYGQVTTYGNIAKKVAAKINKEKMSSRAVGGAVGRNPISIIIPCHRVIGSNGSLTGYAGGVHRKVKLLKLEGVDMERLFIPTKGTAL